jgi:hypothetical protein
MSFAPALVLREGDRDRLGELARLPSVPSGLVTTVAVPLACNIPYAVSVSPFEMLTSRIAMKATEKADISSGACSFQFHVLLGSASNASDPLPFGATSSSSRLIGSLFRTPDWPMQLFT